MDYKEAWTQVREVVEAKARDLAKGPDVKAYLAVSEIQRTMDQIEWGS
ncbi:MAG: hypothetical protein WC277_02095 [Bacilli bacterium]